MGNPGLEDRGPGLRVFCACLIVFSTVALVLRFWSRALTPGPIKFWYDDLLALIALPMNLAQLGLVIYWTTFGLGKHADQVPYDDIMRGLRILYIRYFFFCFGLSLAKLSCLLFYARVFTVTTANRAWCTSLCTIAAFVIGWDVFCVLSATLQCIPVTKAWNERLLGHCLDTYRWWLNGGIVNIIIDVSILVLPMPLLWKLKMDRSRILLLAFVFICGYCVVIASIGKTITVLREDALLSEDVTFKIVDTLYWFTSEEALAMISICMPAMFALVKRTTEYGLCSLISSKATFNSSSWNK